MLIGLGTGSTGTAELARILNLPHEAKFLPWDVSRCPEFAKEHIPRIRAQGGEVGLYLLPYTELLMAHAPEAKFICMQRDQARVQRGLTRKMGRNVFGCEEDAKAFDYGFPFYGSGVTLEEGVARFYREFYELAYSLQRRFPDRFIVLFTDHLLGSETADISEKNIQRLADLARMNHEALWDFCGPELEKATAEVA